MGQLMAMLAGMNSKMDENMRKMDTNTRDMCSMNDKMDASAHDMDANMQALRGDMQTQRGEMQSMGLNLQSGQKAIRAIARGEMRTTDCKMAAPRGGATEPTWSVQCVRPAMEPGKVEGTSDVIIDGETCRTRHEGVTEKLRGD